MEMPTDVLLVTANVGSLFDKVGEIEDDWLQEFFMTVQKHNPCFVALHFQEVGGKDYKVNMGHAEKFFRTIESKHKMADFDRVCVYVDSNFKAVDSFTALGSMYFIHKSLENIQQYDFREKEFIAVSGHNKYMGSLEEFTTIEKKKFPTDIWPDPKSRKGYMRTRWLINNQGLDLVNVHLFHDASNLIACKSSPSEYSEIRKKALRYVIESISDSSYSPLPFFLFGDFNFRLDTCSLVQNLSMSADIQMVKRNSSNEIIYEEKDNDHKNLSMTADISDNKIETYKEKDNDHKNLSMTADISDNKTEKIIYKEKDNDHKNLSMTADISDNKIEKIIYKEKDNDHKVLLCIELKKFTYLHQAMFRENNGKELLKYDKEISAFHDVITEEEIHFPPSYPYSEDYTKPTQYMDTRCPAWCDRILMSHSASDIIHRREEGESGVVYNTLGSNICMGDHKPVFLFFPMKTIKH